MRNSAEEGMKRTRSDANEVRGTGTDAGERERVASERRMRGSSPTERGMLRPSAGARGGGGVRPDRRGERVSRASGAGSGQRSLLGPYLVVQLG